jgi:hypothetical protein
MSLSMKRHPGVALLVAFALRRRAIVAVVLGLAIVGCANERAGDEPAAAGVQSAANEPAPHVAPAEPPSEQPSDPETAPTPALPDAPWSSEVMRAPPELAVAGAIWREVLEPESDDFDCPLYAPIGTGYVAADFAPQFSRVGDFQFGLQQGDKAISVSVWPVTTRNVDRYFDNTEDVIVVEFSDRSIVRRIFNPAANSESLLFALSGVSCFYEVYLFPTSRALVGNVVESFARIDG